MIKKALAAVALAASLAVLAPQASYAADAPVKGPVSGTVTTTDQDAAAKDALSAIEQRLAGDPVLARQFQRAASLGDSVTASTLLATDGTEILGISSSSDTQQVDAVRIRVTITVCVKVWGTVYCGTVVVTVDL